MYKLQHKGSIKDCCVMTYYYWDIMKKKIVLETLRDKLVIFDQ